MGCSSDILTLVLLCTGTGNVYAPFPAFARPSILDYTQSAELDAQFFFTGTPWEMVARNYTAVTLNMANNSTLTQYDVTGTYLHPVSLLTHLHNVIDVRAAHTACSVRPDAGEKGTYSSIQCADVGAVVPVSLHAH